MEALVGHAARIGVVAIAESRGIKCLSGCKDPLTDGIGSWRTAEHNRAPKTPGEATAASLLMAAELRVQPRLSTDTSQEIGERVSCHLPRDHATGISHANRVMCGPARRAYGG